MSQVHTIAIQMVQGIDEHGREFGYVDGENGGYFFTWMETLIETEQLEEVWGENELA